MKKSNKIQIEIKWLYRRLLKNSGKVLSIRNILKFHDDYNHLRGRVLSSPEASHNLKYALRNETAKAPKYLKWAKKYLI